MKKCTNCNLICSDKEDNCPKCGSKLKEVDVDEWASPLDYYD